MVMVKDLKDWDKHDTGMVVMHPVLTAGAVPVTSGGVALRIEYATSAEQAALIVAGRTPPSHIQLGLTLPQLDQMLRILGNAAEKIRKQMSQSGEPN